MPKPEINSMSFEEKLDYAHMKLSNHRDNFERRPSKGRAFKVRKWASIIGHFVYAAHPELREEGSLPRYFVAKAARKEGLRGADVTTFVEKQFEDGTWWKLVPEDVLKGKLKVA